MALLLSQHYRRKAARNAARRYEAQLANQGVPLPIARAAIVVRPPQRIGWRGYRWNVYQENDR